MPSYLATITLAAESGLPEDDFVNNWAFTRALAPISAQIDSLEAAFDQFYDNLGSYISQAATRDINGRSLKLYDITANLDGSPHGSPFATRTGTLSGAASGINMPGEVAMAVTLRSYTLSAVPPAEAPDGADPGVAPDRPRQRRSGRIYLGPLTTQAVTADVNGAGRPSLNFRTDILTEIDALQAAALAAGWTLGVWSRVDAVVNAAVFASVDDAFDTQRRRGPKPTSRTIVTF